MGNERVYMVRLALDPCTKARTPECWGEEVIASNERQARRKFRKAKGFNQDEELICVADS